MDDHENDAEHNVAETCCHSLTLSELTSLSPTPTFLPFSTEKRLTYGSIPGSLPLRTNISSLYAAVDGKPLNATKHVLVTNGAIAANFLLFYSLIQKGDHVICMYPTYQALYEVARSLGAEVEMWNMDVEKGMLPSLEVLRVLLRKPEEGKNGMKPGTKLIVIKYVSAFLVGMVEVEGNDWEVVLIG